MLIQHSMVERSRSSTPSVVAMRLVSVGTLEMCVTPYFSMASSTGSGSKSVWTSSCPPAVTVVWTVLSRPPAWNHGDSCRATLAWVSPVIETISLLRRCADS